MEILNGIAVKQDQASNPIHPGLSAPKSNLLRPHLL